MSLPSFTRICVEEPWYMRMLFFRHTNTPWLPQCNRSSSGTNSIFWRISLPSTMLLKFDYCCIC